MSANDAQSCQCGPVSARCTSLEPLLPYWTRLNTSGDIYSGASASVCSFVATILQEASWQTDGRSAAALHKLLNLLHICVSPGRIFPSSGFDILQDELHAVVLSVCSNLYEQSYTWCNSTNKGKRKPLHLTSYFLLLLALFGLMPFITTANIWVERLHR